MSLKKLLLASMALGLRGVMAQAGVCKEQEYEIKNPDDITALGCRTIQGNLVFSDSDAMVGDVSISGITSIQGDLVINGTTKITSISAPSLSEIGGKFELRGLEKLQRLDFSSLQSVGQIQWTALAQLQTLNFGQDGITTIESVTISDTFLSSLDGLNMVSVGTFDINNNKRLETWETKMTNITENVIISENSPDLAISFPDLEWAVQLEIRGIKSLSVPSLTMVNGTFTLDQCDNMESFVAPNLTEVTQTLSLTNNMLLSNLSFPALETSGPIEIKNNTKLESIDGFPKLTQVSGDVSLGGSFTDVQFPALNDVKGAFAVASSEDISAVCDAFAKKQPRSKGGDNTIQGKYTCTSKSADPSGDSNTGSSGGNTKDAGTLFTVDKTLAFVAALVGGLMQLL